MTFALIAPLEGEDRDKLLEELNAPGRSEAAQRAAMLLARVPA